MRISDWSSDVCSSDLIVLPETVIPLFQDRIAPRIWQQWLAVAQERNAKIIMGIPLHDRLNNTDRYTNSAIAFDARTPLHAMTSGAIQLRYDKHQLVPFCEYVPPGYRWFLDSRSIRLADCNRVPVDRERVGVGKGESVRLE